LTANPPLNIKKTASYLTSEDLYAFNVDSRERGILAYGEAILLLVSAPLFARNRSFRLINM
jgi:hypothetical protein